MESFLIFTIAIIILIIISGFFAAAETAITGVSQATIHKLKLEGNKKAIIVGSLREDKERLISSLLLGNSACNSAISALGATLTIKLFSNAEYVAFSTIFMTVLIFVFAEVLPKSYAFENSERLSLSIAPILLYVVKILYPITTAVQYAVNFILSIIGLGKKSDSVISAAEELRGAIELHHKEGLFVKNDRDMLGSILDLADTNVEEVMIHRKNMIMIDIKTPIDQLIKEILSKNHTRVPIWEDNQDNIIGLLNIKDLLNSISKCSGNFEKIVIKEILTTPWYISNNTLLKEQLSEFRKKKNHFALVINEYGALQGLITLEDIIEEIVGQIEDEHDDTDEEIKIQSDGSHLINGDTSIRDINRHFDWNLPAQQASTIAGLIMYETQTVPEVGEEFVLYNVNLKIIEKDNNHLSWIKVTEIEKKI